MNSTHSARHTDVLRRTASVIAVPLGALASLSTIAIMIAITVDVVVRNFGGHSVPGLLEMSESALVATVFLGLAYAGATNSHVAVDLLTEALPRLVSRTLIGIAWVLSVIISVWFVVATFERAVESTESDELRQGLVDWPVWPARWLIVVGLVAFLVIAVINIVLLISGKSLLGEDRIDPDLAAAQKARHAGATPLASGVGGEGDRTDGTSHPPEEGRS